MSHRIKKIAFLDYSPVFAGAERMLYNMIAHIDKLKYEPIIVFPYPMAHQKIYDSLKCEKIYLADSLSWWMGSDRWEHPLRGTDFIKRTELGRRLANIVNARDIDIVDVNLMRGDVKMWVWATKKFTQAKIVGHYRSQEQGFVPSAHAQKLFDLVACVSKFSLLCFQRKGLFTNSIVLYDSVDIDRMICALSKDEAKRKLGFNSDIILLSSIGQLSVRKGHDNAIRAFGQISRKYPKTRLLIAGGGSNDQIELYKRIATKEGVAEKVIIPGEQLTDIQTVYKATDITLSLSKDGEGFGLVPYESVLIGTPFIGPNIGAILEFVVDQKNGLLVNPNDIDAIVDKISYALENGAMMLSMVENLKQIIITKLSPNILAENLEKAYESLYKIN